jgi:phosphohistidine swiveling domain-containing protein
VRDEQLYLNRWKSWREDDAPLRAAVRQMQNDRARRPIKDLVENAARESREALGRAVQQIVASDPREGGKRARVLEACVRACRTHYPMKDDRDIVLSHAQSALRWVLMEADRRLRTAGATHEEGEVFLFEPQELLDHFADGGPSPQQLSEIRTERLREQARLARYTRPIAVPTPEEGVPEGDTLQGGPASAGIAEGRACVVSVDAYEDISKLQEGDILVLKGEGKVGWTMFFTNIAGLVYTNGNWLCHETTLCRELGKPAVVGLGAEVERIRDGELLRIDGAKGTVQRLGGEG